MAGIRDVIALDITDELDSATMPVCPIVSNDGRWIVLCFRRDHIDLLYFYQYDFDKKWHLESIYEAQALHGRHVRSLISISWAYDLDHSLVLIATDENKLMSRWKRYPLNRHKWIHDGYRLPEDIDAESRFSAIRIQMNHGARKGRTFIYVKEW